MTRVQALAADYDGTLADLGQIDPPVLEALRRFRSGGRRLLLVTGRELSELLPLLSEVGLFDRIVAENGALLYWPETRRERLLGEGAPPVLIERLRARGVSPLSVGRSIVATLTVFKEEVAQVLKDFEGRFEVSLNKESLMILPRGVNKGSGLRAALAEMDVPPREVAGAGDGENDLPLFEVCGFRVALANSVPQLKAQADYVATRPSGRGVIEALDWLNRNE